MTLAAMATAAMGRQAVPVETVARLAVVAVTTERAVRTLQPLAQLHSPFYRHTFLISLLYSAQ